MTLNNQQFRPESLDALQRLADIPDYSEDFDPHWDKSTHEERVGFMERTKKYHAENIKPLEEHTMSLMEKERVPHHPKLKEQYDRGSLTGPEYARELLMFLHHS